MFCKVKKKIIAYLWSGIKLVLGLTCNFISLLLSYKVSFYDVYTMKKPDFLVTHDPFGNVLPRFVQYKKPSHKRSNQRGFRISLDDFALHQL